MDIKELQSVLAVHKSKICEQSQLNQVYRKFIGFFIVSNVNTPFFKSGLILYKHSMNIILVSHTKYLNSDSELKLCTTNMNFQDCP